MTHIEPTSPAYRRLLAPVRLWAYPAKVDLVVALRAGLVTRDEVKAVHGLSDAVLTRWEGLFERGGPDALRARPYRPRRAA